MNWLLFKYPDLTELRTSLLRSETESAAFIFARCVDAGPTCSRLLVQGFDYVDDRDYTIRTSTRAEIEPHAVAAAVKKARRNGYSLVLAHTHPWDGVVGPSMIDRDGERALLPVMFRRVPGVHHGRLILGHEDTHAALRRSVSSEHLMKVQELGRCVMGAPRLIAGEPSPVYARQAILLGHLAQEVIASMRVAIVGLGGTGSVVAQELAHLGVSDFVFIDPDFIDETNLNRVAGAGSGDIGTPKVVVAARMVGSIREGAQVESIQGDVTDSVIARRTLCTDFFFSCTDSHGSRAVMTQLSSQFWLPGIDLGVRIDAQGGTIRHVGGRVQMLSPGLPCLQCSQVLDAVQVRRDLMTPAQRAADPYVVGSTVAQPAVMSLNGTVASLAATMFMSAVTGVPTEARYQVADFDRGTVKAVNLRPDPECVVCSTGGFFGRGDTWPMPGRSDPEVHESQKR